MFPDRLEFPKDFLGNLYIAQEGKPPRFCLVRDDINEWYSNKQIKDLIIRPSNWLRDAAAGELPLDGNQFEPLRLEGYNGSLTYDYDLAAKVIKEDNRQ